MSFSSLTPERKSRLKAILDKNTHKAGPNDCWLYENTHPRGYGRLGVRLGNGKMFRTHAHRVAFALHYNIDVPDNLFCCHSCDVRACANPTHIFLANAKLNAKDASLKGRIGKGRIHPL